MADITLDEQQPSQQDQEVKDPVFPNAPPSKLRVFGVPTETPNPKPARAFPKPLNFGMVSPDDPDFARHIMAMRAKAFAISQQARQEHFQTAQLPNNGITMGALLKIGFLAVTMGLTGYYLYTRFWRENVGFTVTEVEPEVLEVE